MDFPKVAITNESSIRDSIWKALNLLDCCSLFPHKHIAIKINETMDPQKDLSACTQPDTLQAVVDFVKQYKPKYITITGGSGDAQTFDAFNLLGIGKIEGVEFFDHNREPFEELDIGFCKVMVNPYVLEYDVLISLAQLKVHDDTLVTLSLKNVAMSYPAADYYGYPRSKIPHDKTIHTFIASMCKKFPIDLSIIVGHPVMVDKGPIGGRTFDTNLVIASRDPVAADSIGAKLLGEFNVPYIAEAERMGVGQSDFYKIEVIGISFHEARQFFEKCKGVERDTRAIIMAGGSGQRWRNYLSVPKHLISIDGETLLSRTVRLLNLNNIKDIIIVGPPKYDNRYIIPGTRLVPSKDDRCFEFELYNKTGINTNLVDPNKKTVVLLGDVFYSNSIIDALLYGISPVGFIRFMGKSKYGLDRKELWGFSFNPEFQNNLYEAIRSIDTHPIHQGWTCGVVIFDKLYRTVNYSLSRVDLYLNDYTCDFDDVEDYHQWLKFREQWKIQNLNID